MWLWWLSMAWALDCEAPVPLGELEATLGEAEQAYVDFDDVLFRDKVNIAAGILLPCVGDALPAATASRFHQVTALHLFTIGDEANAALAIQAARAVDPDAELSTELFPDGTPGRQAWDAYEPAPTHKVPEPRYGSIAFDGEHTRARPKQLPHIVQLFDESGLARTTNYLAPREPLPPYPAIPRQRNMLIACGAGGAVGSAVLLGASWAVRGALLNNARDLSTPSDTLDGQRGTMNALAAGSAGLLGVGVGCGASALVIGER